MNIGVFATFMSPFSTAAMIQDVARRAEAAGLESLWMGEHVVLFDEMEFPYPALPTAEFRYQKTAACSIPWQRSVCLRDVPNACGSAPAFASCPSATPSTPRKNSPPWIG